MTTPHLSRRAFLFGDKSVADAMEDESGAAVIEYGLIGMLMFMSLVAAMTRSGRSNTLGQPCDKMAMRRAGDGETIDDCPK